MWSRHSPTDSAAHRCTCSRGGRHHAGPAAGRAADRWPRSAQRTTRRGAVPVHRRCRRSERGRLPRLHRSARRGKATALQALGRLGEAISELRELLNPTGAAGQGQPEAPPIGGEDLTWQEWATLQVALARCHHLNGDDPAAVRAAEEAFARAMAEAGSDAAVLIGATLAELYLDQGELLLARQLAGQEVGVAEDTENPHTRVTAYQHAAVTAEAAGDTEQAAHMAERILLLLNVDEEVHALDDLRTQCAGLLL